MTSDIYLLATLVKCVEFILIRGVWFICSGISKYSNPLFSMQNSFNIVCVINLSALTSEGKN